MEGILGHTADSIFDGTGQHASCGGIAEGISDYFDGFDGRWPLSAFDKAAAPSTDRPCGLARPRLTGLSPSPLGYTQSSR